MKQKLNLLLCFNISLEDSRENLGKGKNLIQNNTMIYNEFYFQEKIKIQPIQLKNNLEC